MISRVQAMGVSGMAGIPVSVECFISGGLPKMEIVGLPDAAVKEARERIRAAIKSAGFSYPKGHVTLNLAPADVKKTGTFCDLPMLLCILSAQGDLPALSDRAAFVGELSLYGQVRPVPGALPMALAAKAMGLEEIFVPADNAGEAALADGPRVYPVESVSELIRHITGEEAITPAVKPSFTRRAAPEPDMCEVLGQESAKRGLEIAAAGGHNMIMVGPPGSGKSMLAKRMPSILPDLSEAEMLQVTEIYSVAGLTGRRTPIITERPFRNPHHTASSVALAGGGANPKPGEVSLAHNGVLFLDELPEFQRPTLESLRQPMEDGSVTVSRAAGTFEFPSRFMLVCAMNPCKCGWYGEEAGKCSCSQNAVHAYLHKVSGPLLDRIDIRVNLHAVKYDELVERRRGESSAEIKERVNKARCLQRDRYMDGAMCNAALSPKETVKWCQVDEEGAKMLKAAFIRMNMTARSYDRVLRVARTIADLDGSDRIGGGHVAEALQFRDPVLFEI